MMRFAFSILCLIAPGIGLWVGCLSVVEVELMAFVVAVGMTIDVKTETVVSFSDARSAFPGDRRVSLATLHRWRQRGIRGITLETFLIGGLRYTSLEAIDRFIALQNERDTPSVSITAGQRQRQSEAAQVALEKMGVGGGVSRTIARPTNDFLATTGVTKQ